MAFYVKIHESYGKKVVAICDEELIGEKFEDKDKNLNLNISESFYKGEIKNNDEVLEILKSADNLNIAGENIVNLALENKIISKENILFIKKVPSAMVFSI